MTRRKAKRLLKKACLFVAIGTLMFSPLFLLPDSNAQPKKTNKLDSHKRVKESRYKVTAKQTPAQKGNTTSSPKARDALKDDPAPDIFFPPQKSRYEACANYREAEKLQFHELLQESVIYSAFLDYRFKEQSLIRMISILPSYGEQTQLYCHFLDSSTLEYFTSVVEIEELGTNEGYEFQGFLSSCDLPEEIDSYYLCSVNISVEAEANRQNDRNTKEIALHVVDRRVNVESYGLCVPPITGEISLTRLVEFIELSQILGVSHFTFYNSKASAKTQEVLRYYRDKGILTFYPWQLPHYISANIQDNGQTAALNDCLYRSLGKFAYVAFNNLEEFIVPLQEKVETLQIIESVKDENAAGYCFKNFMFDTANSVDKNAKTQIYTQRFISRIKTPIDQLSRCIVSPKKILSLDLNTILNLARNFYTVRHVDPSFGHVFHYHECNDREWDCGDYREDHTMEKYREQLEMRFNATMTNLRHYSSIMD